MLAWEFYYLCNASSKSNNQIKITYYVGTKKMALNSQTIRAKETPKLSHGLLSKTKIYSSPMSSIDIHLYHGWPIFKGK